MTESSGGKTEAVGIEFPHPVTFKEDTPRKGYFSLHLGIKDLRVNKAFLGLGKSTPKNAEVNPSFSTQSVCTKVTVQGSDGKPQMYEYKKTMPEDIEADKCIHKVKDGRVVLIIAKTNTASWEQHRNYLCFPSENQ